MHVHAMPLWEQDMARVVEQVAELAQRVCMGRLLVLAEVGFLGNQQVESNLRNLLQGLQSIHE
jgi:acetoin utilization deacetylase AcuC-like enzyme